ncbi:hypothetical protein [Bosea sp. UC22_33]|uniref:hypothetical protein n=1 Tax=Bosea sp. UC22_33 TaxID=3350165 RepID=UPI00366AF4DF
MIVEELFSVIGFKVEGVQKLRAAVKEWAKAEKATKASTKAIIATNKSTVAAAAGASRLGTALRTILAVFARLIVVGAGVAAGIAAVGVAFAVAGVRAAKARREMALTAKEFGTTSQNSETLTNIYKGLGLGDDAGEQAKKSIEAMSEITKAIKKGGEEADEARKKLKGFGVDASLAIGADGTMRDSSALALDVIEAYKRVSAGAKALRDQQKSAPKGKQKALGAKALKEERRADQFAEDAGITGRLRVLIDEKSMPELRAIYEKIASLFPTMSSGQEGERARLAKQAQEAGLKLDAALDGLTSRFSDLGVAIGNDVLPAVNSLLDKIIGFGKATGLIKETTKEKRDRESYEAASKRAEGRRAERLTTEDLQSQADASQKRFEESIKNRAERMKQIRQQLSPEASTAKMVGTAQASTDNRKYENIGNDQRTISPNVTVNATGLDAVASAVKNAVLGAISTKGANTSTGALTAP